MPGDQDTTTNPFRVYLNPSLVLFIIGMSMRFYASGDRLFPYNEYESDLVRNLGLIVLGLSFVFALAEGKLRNLQKKYRYWFFALITALLLLLIHGVYRANEAAAFLYDAASFTYLSALLVGSERRNWKALEKMLLVHFLVGTLANIYGLATFSTVPLRPDPALGAGAALEVVGTMTRWQVLLYPWPYFLLTFYRGGIGRKVLTFVGLSVVFISFIFCQKRAPVSEFLFLALLAIFFYVLRRRLTAVELLRNFVKVICFAVVFGLLFYCSLKVVDPYNVFQKSLGGLKDRILHSDSGKRLTTTEAFSRARYVGSDRFREAKYFFREASTKDVLIGRGMGGRAHTPVMGYTNLHVGLASLVLKGGVLFAVLWLFGWLVVLVDFLKARKTNPYIFCYALVAKYLIFLILVPAWGIWPNFGFLLLCSGACMSKWVKDI